MKKLFPWIVVLISLSLIGIIYIVRWERAPRQPVSPEPVSLSDLAGPQIGAGVIEGA